MIPVLRMLYTIAGMTVTVRRNFLYLTPQLTYNELPNFVAQSPIPPDMTRVALGMVSQGATTQAK